MAGQRLLALDLDGTLLRSDLTVSPANRAAVAACLHEGIHVVLASGRTSSSVEPYARLWEGHPLWIAGCNGAEIRPAGGGPAVLRRLVPLSLARSVANWARAAGLYLKTYVDDVLLVDEVTAETLAFSRAHGVPYRAVGNVAAALDAEPTKMVIVEPPERIAALVPLMREMWGDAAEVTTSEPHSLELTAQGVDKGSAVQFLADHLRVESGAAAAIGNAQNDVSMITWAGFGGVVRNAPPDVRAATPIVVSHHDDDGVAEFIAAWRAHMKVIK